MIFFISVNLKCIINEPHCVIWLKLNGRFYTWEEGTKTTLMRI